MMPSFIQGFRQAYLIFSVVTVVTLAMLTVGILWLTGTI
jgi:hypothetical protein